MKFWLIPFGMAQNVPILERFDKCVIINLWAFGIQFLPHPGVKMPVHCRLRSRAWFLSSKTLKVWANSNSQQSFAITQRWGNQRNTPLKTMKVYTLSKSGWVSRILAQQFGVSIYVVGSTRLFVGSMRKMLDAQLLVGHHLPGQSRSTETCVDNGSNAHLLIVDAGVI